MSESNATVKTSNPGPLGLIGFGMTSILLNLHNTGIIELSIVIVSMGIALGGLAQIVAGIVALRQGSTFAGTAFTAYGLFWWSLVIIWLNPTAAIPAGSSASLGFYLLLWGIFTLFLFIATLKHDRATQTVFLTLTLLFLGLALGNFSGIEAVTVASGWIGILCGASAVYASVGQVINEEFGKPVVPLG
jgi:succinate-acetate transporter protein